MSSTARDIILKVEDVSKVYHLNQKFQASVKDVFSSRTKVANSTYTALKDISFELRKGESLGIFGANGAGKSTMLRILSGITKPSTGVVDIFGRSLSILEIGTGFHPDLTGKENIFSNGEILGMERSAIESKLDEIIAFSELAEYINEPVKNYSSGMYLRLAFSVIAFLDADLMLFDETMSVGDLSFRKKCRDKIESLLKAGKSMIVVSHNMNEIISLCNKFMHLEGGQIKAISDNYEILAQYMDSSINPQKNLTGVATFSSDQNSLVVNDFSGFNIPASVEITSITLLPTGAAQPFTDPLFRDNELQLTVEYIKKENGPVLDVSFTVLDGMGSIVLVCSPIGTGHSSGFEGTGKCRVMCTIPKNLFNQGLFYLNLYFTRNKRSIEVSMLRLLTFQINFRPGEYEGVHSKLLHIPGALAPLFEWELKHV
jgi:lipopolysaccharide transport system ATP-binding protein